MLIRNVAGDNTSNSEEVIVIPQIKSDMTGHADGLVRFVDRNIILGNQRMHEYNIGGKE